MISICESYLQQYLTTIEQDIKLISDKKLFNVLTRQQRMAIKLRVSEKRILQSTMKAVNDELNRLPSIVRGDRIIPAGRSFDTLMSKKDKLTNTNTYSSWVDIRNQKKPNIDNENNNETNESNNDNNKDNKSSSIAERRRKRRTG